MDLKNENAKYLIEQISEKALSLTKLKITKASFSTKENEWKSYINQTKPHWEDITWRIKLNEKNSEAKILLTLFSGKPPANFLQILESIEELVASNQFAQIDIKTEKSIAIGWLIDDIENGYMIQVKLGQILTVLDSFIKITLENLVKNAERRNDENYSVGSQEIKIELEGNEIELMHGDHPLLLDWHEAKTFEQSNTEGWRLPSLDELQLIFNKIHITGIEIFKDDKPYWSRNEVESKPGMAYAFFFDYGQKFDDTKDYKSYVRFVRG